MEQKWAGQLEKIYFFIYCSKVAHYIFLIFCIKVEGIKGYKLAQTPFLRKFSFGRFSPFLLIFGPKINFFVYCSKLGHYIFFDILHEVKRHYKGYKLLQTPFLVKILFCRFLPFLLIFCPKINFFVYCSKLQVFAKTVRFISFLSYLTPSSTVFDSLQQSFDSL